jgi:hypothetical protein
VSARRVPRKGDTETIHADAARAVRGVNGDSTDSTSPGRLHAVVDGLPVALKTGLAMGEAAAIRTRESPW